MTQKVRIAVDVMGGDAIEGGSALQHNTSAAETVDGFTVNVVGGFDSPNDAYEREAIGSGSYDIDSYLASGWAATAKAVDTWGDGHYEVDYLQRDVEVRFTGVYGAPVPMANGGVSPLYQGSLILVSFHSLVGSRPAFSFCSPMPVCLPNPNNSPTLAMLSSPASTPTL